jgi:sigma-E factor negative regulatory protein RseB
MKILILIAALGLSLNAVAAVEEDVNVRTWLDRMTSAMEQIDYQGTFVYVQEGNIDSMRITHVFDGQGSSERLYSITGPHREIIRSNGELKCVFTEDQSVVIDKQMSQQVFPAIPVDLLTSPDARYSMQLGGQERVAGHTAQVIEIKPLDKFRYGYSLWLEVNSGVLLKSVLRDSNQLALAKLMFTEIRFGDDVDHAELQPGAADEEYVNIAAPVPYGQPASVSEQPQWHPAQLPPGFRLSSHNHENRDNGQVYEHLVYSDGLASVSVYIESLSEEQGAMTGLSRIGALNAYARQRNDLQITAIGEVPELTVKTIAETIQKAAHGD